MRAHNISVYIAKYDTNGNFVWVKKAGGSGRAEAEAVAYQGGQVYVTGGFQGRIDIRSMNEAF